MRTYETTYIIDGSVSDADREAIIARLGKILTDNGAEILRTVRWGKRQLAFEIKKQTRGYYVIFYFNANPSIISAFHHEMDINERIFRYMTLLSDGKHPDYIKDEGEPADLAPAPSTVSEVPVQDEETDVESSEDVDVDEKEEADEAVEETETAPQEEEAEVSDEDSSDGEEVKEEEVVEDVEVDEEEEATDEIEKDKEAE